MPADVRPASSVATDAYRRQARRLRCRYAGQPGRLQRSLKALAEARTPDNRHGRADRPPHPAPGAGFPSSPRCSAAQRFADHLAADITGPVLRYSQRLQLLRAARRLGIERFEANLLIAAVVDRRQRGAGAASPQSAGMGGAMLSGVAVLLLVQAAIALGAWWTVFR